MDVDKELKHFFEALGPLADKTLALLIQLPPSIPDYTKRKNYLCCFYFILVHGT
jgi:hypothetical protein